MATSIIDIQTIYGTMITEIVRDPDVWISFLNCAGMNYKYNFSEQLLIYSQKPNAIAWIGYNKLDKKDKDMLK